MISVDVNSIQSKATRKANKLGRKNIESGMHY
jgi:hypothetical protein